MSLDKSKIPKLSDSSRKFIPKKQRHSVNDPSVERTKWIWKKKGIKISGGMVGIKKQKASEEKGAMLEVEINPNPALDKNHAGRGMEENGNRRLTSESTPVEQGHDFAILTGTLDREEILTKNAATAVSPTDNTMMHGVTEKAVSSSSFSKRVMNSFGNFFPFTMGTGAGDEVDTQEEEEDNEEIDDFDSQVSLSSSTHESEASTNMETGYSNRLAPSEPKIRLLMENKSQESSCP